MGTVILRNGSNIKNWGVHSEGIFRCRCDIVFYKIRVLMEYRGHLFALIYICKCYMCNVYAWTPLFTLLYELHASHLNLA